ncbi:MAG: formylglycine-generating enzyme family protein [Pseudomonadota bacterium]
MLLTTLFFLAAEPAISWVALDGGCYTMGTEQGYPEEQPPRDVCVSAFEISKTEITNAQFTAFIDATGYVTTAEKSWPTPDGRGGVIQVPAGSAVFAPPSKPRFGELDWWRFVEGANWRKPRGPDVRYEVKPEEPVVHVTVADALAYASWAGGDLPTEEEWEYAARAGKLLDDAEKKAMADQANTWQGLFPVLNTKKDGFEGVAPVASFPANGFGLHDMLGNVWELTSSPYTASHSDADREAAGTDGFDPTQPGMPVVAIRGGSYLCAQNYCARYRPTARQGQDRQLSTSHIGFRIVRRGETVEAVE